MALTTLNEEPLRGRVENDLHLLLLASHVDWSVVELIVKFKQTSLVVDTEPMLAKLALLRLLVLILLLGNVEIDILLQLSLWFALELTHPVAEEQAHVSKQVRLRLLRSWNKFPIQISLDEGSVGRADFLGLNAGKSSFFVGLLLFTLVVS